MQNQILEFSSFLIFLLSIKYFVTDVETILSQNVVTICSRQGKLEFPSSKLFSVVATFLAGIALLFG